VVRRRVALRRAIEALLALRGPCRVPCSRSPSRSRSAWTRRSSCDSSWWGPRSFCPSPISFARCRYRRGILAAYRQLDPSLEEAAASLGAGRWRTLTRVTLPQLKPGLAAGASLAFVAGLGDIVASIVLYTYETRPV